MCLTLENLCLHRQLEIFIELQQKASFKPNENMQCLLEYLSNSTNWYRFAVDEFSKLVRIIIFNKGLHLTASHGLK